MFENIIKLCKERGITVTVLEKELGFGNCTISKWKNVSPSINKVKKVAEYFGVSIEDLLKE